MRTMLALALLLVIAAPVLAGDTQLEMNADACADLERADAELNDVWKKVVERNPERKKALQAAQKAWIAFRDAELKAVFDGTDGSIVPMCRCRLGTELTRQRTATLRAEWLEGIEEGDVCIGNRPMRSE